MVSKKVPYPMNEEPRHSYYGDFRALGSTLDSAQYGMDKRHSKNDGIKEFEEFRSLSPYPDLDYFSDDPRSL